MKTDAITRLFLFDTLSVVAHNLVMLTAFSSSHRPRSGFTIIELTIVLAIIALLALLTGAGYSAVRRNAVETGLRNDIKRVSELADVGKTQNGWYPAVISNAQASDDVTIRYSAHAQGYCVSAVNAGLSGLTLNYKSSTGEVTEGICDSNVESFAGTGSSGSTNSTYALSTFGSVRLITGGPDGSLYISDATSRLRKLSGGNVTQISNSTVNLYGDIVATRDGVIYATDMNNHRVRKISQTGVITTFAGSGTNANLDGQGTAAHFSYPAGIDIDRDGNLYVVDSGTNVIRKITPGGYVSTISGTPGEWGFQDGTAAAARFDAPEGLAIDSTDTYLHIVDTGNSAVRKVRISDGSVTTLAGTGTYGFADGAADEAQFAAPSTIAVDQLGNSYVGDNANYRVRKITPDGTVSTLAGSTTGTFLGGPGSTARIRVWGVYVDASGDVYVAGSSHYRVLKITQP